MVDLSGIGNAGLIMQYEDTIAMTGFNVARYFRGKEISKKLDDTSVKDVLSSYVDREDEDYTVWLKKTYDVDVDSDTMLSSFLAMQPSLLYSYKVFQASHQDKHDSLYIYSEKYSPIAEEATKSYGFDGVQYIHGDIIKFLEAHPNCTYITASYKALCDLKKTDVPVCVVVCDDYVYTAKIVEDGTEKVLQEKPNILLRYTSIISAGIIN